MRWWEERIGLGSSLPAESGSGPQESEHDRLLRDGYYSTADREDWTPVCEIDPLTGQIRRVNPDWSREVGGWRPLDDFLRGR